MAFIEMPISFKRQYNSSLVEDEVFASAQERTNYLSSGLAYAGQIVAQSDDASVYVVNSTVDGYIKLGSSADISFKIVTDYNSLPKGGDIPTSNTVFYCVKDYVDNQLTNYYNKEEIDNIIIEGGNIDIDLSSYVKKVDLERDYAKKSDIPTIPTFKTINGQSIIGEGNITIESSGEEGSTPVESNYNPTLNSSTQVTTEIGSIKAGSILADLAGKSYSEIIDAMLVNEVWNDPRYVHTVSLGNVISLVKVGTSVVTPAITAVWNNNIQSNSTKTITYDLAKTILGSSETVYNKSGNSTFVLTYSYPEGYYDIVSNLGNTKRITVPSKTNATISKIVTATYPWFINNTEQALVAIGDSKTIEIELTGSPSIKVPFTNSTVTIQADLGFGWMDVDWDVSIDNTNLGGAVDETVPYKVYSKSDSYSNSVKHKITINLSK